MNFRIILILLNISFMNAQNVLFDSKSSKNIDNWSVVDDRVMGGVSQGNFSINNEGFALFSGKVSTDYNGGFSSVRYNCKPVIVTNAKTIKIRLKGDGKYYQCRIKPNNSVSYSYIKPFKTSGEWETIVMKFSEMEASFRGRKLDIPNFNHETITEMAFLIGNKVKENFELQIEKIVIE